LLKEATMSTGSSLFGLDSNASTNSTTNNDDDDGDNDNVVVVDDADRITLTAKPHAFAGAVLCPKHARELTPSLCLAVASALAEQSHHSSRSSVPYTLWITEAWRILGACCCCALFCFFFFFFFFTLRKEKATIGRNPVALFAGFCRSRNNRTTHSFLCISLARLWRWCDLTTGIGEPSAALFWELATMFHTLYLAARAFAAEFEGPSQGIPPILSCGSTSSMGSGMTNTNNDAGIGGSRGGGGDYGSYLHRKRYSVAASAKELPVWLISTFLLLHCEEFAYERNLSGKDDRRFFGDGGGHTGGGISSSSAASSSASLNVGARMDFYSLFRNASLSPRYGKNQA
jgi:hypothetical protein